MFKIVKTDKYTIIFILGIKITLKKKEKKSDIDSIVWWIPSKKLRNVIRNLYNNTISSKNDIHNLYNNSISLQNDILIINDNIKTNINELNCSIKCNITETNTIILNNTLDLKNYFNECLNVNKDIILNEIRKEKYVTNFSDHYEYWRAKRVVAIVEHYGESFFKNKKILELGCGYGDIGKVFIGLGAEVIFAEGREEHVNILKNKFPNNRVYKVNLENEWPFKDEKFDLILHLGVLYHLDNIEFSLEKSILNTSNLVLETEVCDSDDPDLVLKIDENMNGYDQSLIGKGSRPSGKYLENIFKKYNCSYEIIKDKRCNALFHRYDWSVKNTNTWEHGLRRFYFIETRPDQTRPDQTRPDQTRPDQKQ